MKDSKNDSTSVLSRFGRDKRTRTVTATAERVERRPRLQRDAADSEPADEERRPARRASYNPHFTADNRPTFAAPHRDDTRPYRNASEGERGPRPHSDNFRGDRTYGHRFDREGDETPTTPRPRYAAHGPQKQKSYYGSREGREGREGRESRESRESRDFRDSRGQKPAYGSRNSYGSPKGAYGSKGPKGAKGGYGVRSANGPKRMHEGDRRTASTSYPRYAPEQATGAIRLNRFIAQSGICSRREADDFIQAGVVTVNGQVVTELGTKVLPTDEVRFNDQRLQGEKKVYLVLNKPKGYVTSLDDPHAGKTVMELVKGACEERIYPVGRLDKNSLGLLLFTNDGDLTKQLTHPSYRKKKIYQVTLDKPLTRADMDRIAEGITLEDGEIHADEISYVKENRQEVGIEIHSGRNRIVRRIFEFLGYTVTKLDRVYYAGLTKKNLKRGAWRFLTREEVERLKSGLYE